MRCCRSFCRTGLPIAVIVALLAAIASANAQPALAVPGAPHPSSLAPAHATAPGAPSSHGLPFFTVTTHGAGRPMLLIPGLASHGDVWDGAVAHFAERYELHVLTLAGFAGVPPLDSAAAPRFLAAQRDAIIRYVRERRLEHPVLVGHSLGAFLAFAVAAGAPDLVGPVIAVDGVPYLMTLGDSTMTPERARPQAAAIRAAYATLGAEQLAAQTRASVMAMTRDTARLAVAAEWGRRSDPTTVGRAVAEMMTTDLRGAVAAIRTPVLLVGAAEAARTEAARADVRRAYERQVASVPRHEVALAERARHFVMWDDPAFLFATMDDFLARAAAPRP